MAQLLLHNARVILESGIQHGGVLIRDQRIALVFAHEQTPAGLSTSGTIDLGGAYLAPGLIDIHIHGSAGVDVQSTDAAGLTKLSAFLLAEGVTGYFATFVPSDEQGYRDSIAAIGSYVNQQDDEHRNNKAQAGARILGIHFEGPFVSEHRCGALRREHFRTYDGDARSLEQFIGEPSLSPRLMTLAPETQGGLDLTRELTRNGVRVFIGHSQADPATLDLAFEAGARHITHFPNALDPLHHRKPGAVAWGLLRDDVTLDCIADFHHVHPLMLRLIYQSKSAARMALISDAIMPAGLGDGEFSVWGEGITVRDGRTALARQPGESTIAGSVITMRQAVRNIVGLGVPVPEAVRMASLVPARIAGIESELGSIKEGKRAELIAFDDEFAVRSAVIGGSLVRLRE
ncbi:MAG TPA: N-acetylglucosamine-6-phosphate deacetylase [Blastocatellia bacterium]|nr:N-acetylglucosamine-6-phosphate deacetylase [Blastocatellia bacterium]